jgi:hypothetical protein
MISKKIDITNLNYKEQGYLIGLFVGDGYLYHDRWGHYKVNFFLNPAKDKDIADFTVFLLKKIGLSPYTMIHHRCLIIRLNSKAFYVYLQEQLNNIFKRNNKKFVIGFISGFIDSDGYVANGDIVISNRRKSLLKNSQFFCRQLDIHSKLWKQRNSYNGNLFTIWRLRVSTKFKYMKHYSQKIRRIYGGAKAAHHSEHSSNR